MKQFYFLSVIFMLFTSAFAIGENPQTVSVNLRTYPSKIQYGDALFAFVEIKNNTNETLVIPSRLVRPYLENDSFLGTVIQLLKEEEVIYEWRDTRSLDSIEGIVSISEPPPYALTKNYPRQNLKTGGSHIIGTRVLWCPQYEFSSYPFVRINFERFVDTRGGFAHTRRLSDFQVNRFKNMLAGQNDFFLSSDISVFALDLLNPDKQIRRSHFTPYVHGMIDTRQPENLPLRIDVRSSETRELLTRWFLELPSTHDSFQWTIDGIFASPFYVSGSPFNVNASSPQELYEKRQSVHADYVAFFSKMESSTPEIKARIKQTNELAEKLRVLPDSEVSLYMKEFIVLRGLLVDLRYADRNDVARDENFDKIVHWLQKSKFRTLWVLVLKECGLPGIRNDKHFSQQVVDNYIGRLIVAFPKEAAASLADLDKEQADFEKNASTLLVETTNNDR